MEAIIEGEITEMDYNVEERIEETELLRNS